MRYLFILFFNFAFFSSFSQYKYLKDSSYTSPFNYLTGATSINNGMAWDEDNYRFPIGFDFWLFDEKIDSMSIFSGNIMTSHPDPDNASIMNIIVANGADLIDRDTSLAGSFSPISRTLSGTAPNRICKIEWRNAGFYNGMDNGEYADSINFKIWLYETSNIIEAHFGNSYQISTNSILFDDGPGVWFGAIDSFDINNGDVRVSYFFKGNANTPTLDSVFSLANMVAPPGVNGIPPSGMVYRLTPKKPGAVNTGYNQSYEIEPFWINYLNDYNLIKVDFFENENAPYMIYDLNGKIVQQGILSKGVNKINTGSLSNGMYVLKIHSKIHRESFKFTKQ